MKHPCHRNVPERARYQSPAADYEGQHAKRRRCLPGALGAGSGGRVGLTLELITGHNPADAQSLLTLEPASPSATGGVFRLNHVRPDVRYVLESSTDLAAWDRLSENSYEVEGPGALYDERTDAGERPRCFYRVTVEQETDP